MKRVTLTLDLPEAEEVSIGSETSALLIIDMQNDFVHERGALYVGEQARRIIPRIKSLLKYAREKGVTAIFTQDDHPPDDPEFKVWPPHAVRGSWGAEIVEELQPVRDERIIKKSTYDPWFNTRLEALLRERRIQELVVTGAVSNICVLHAVGGASLRGFTTIIPVDCIAALSEADQTFTLRQFKKVYSSLLTESPLLTFS